PNSPPQPILTKPTINPASMKIKIRPTNQTLGHALIHNTCQSPIYLWSAYRRDPASGGIALKITRVADGLYAAAPQMVFAYNLMGEQVWYDLSDVFGDPFSGSPVRVEYRGLAGEEDDEDKKKIEWEEGVSPGGSMVRVAGAEGI
ncbi:Bys1 family protein, partial [Aspergillus novofumigatus IBT 16806]